MDVLSNLKKFNLLTEFEGLILRVKSNFEAQKCMLNFQEALDNPKRIISEPSIEGANGRSSFSRNVVISRHEVEKLLTELYQSNFRAQIEIFEMEVQLEWKSKKYPVQV